MGFLLEGLGIFLLHGFLGQPSDWQPVLEKIPVNPKWQFFAVDYFREKSLNPKTALQDWGEAFNQFVLSKKLERYILVGYSLGGRLAMQAVAQNPSLWEQTIFISAHPGFADSAMDERMQRISNDEAWAKRFCDEDWEEVLKLWNSQAVFAGNEKEPLREEKDYQRYHLAAALRDWSLAVQPDMRFLLRNHSAKITWVTGAQDQKFCAQAAALQNEMPGLCYVNIPEASHRVLFDQPERLAAVIASKLK